MQTIVALAAFLLLAVPLDVPAPLPAAPPSRPVVVGSQAPELLAYYPKAALAAGIEGQAEITCLHDLHRALKHCVLDSEDPAGQGFGAAALALAAQSPENPWARIDTAEADVPETLTVAFHQNPTAITPDLLEPRATPILRPSWSRLPTPQQMQRVYPDRAERMSIEGHATLECWVDNTDALTGCVVTEETPADQGFGAAALKLSHAFILTPAGPDGRLVAGGRIVLPIRFDIPKPWTPPPPAAPGQPSPGEG